MEKRFLVAANNRLFKTTIWGGVFLFSPEATREFYVRLRLLNAATLLRKMPNSVDTIIGTHGTFPFRRQRIVQPAAILKDAPIVV